MKKIVAVAAAIALAPLVGCAEEPVEEELEQTETAIEEAADTADAMGAEVVEEELEAEAEQLDEALEEDAMTEEGVLEEEVTDPGM